MPFLTSYRHLLSGLIVGWLMAGLMLSGAEAQDNSDEARQAFVEGSEAAEAGRWTDSLALFEQAYELSNVPTALYNVAIALRSLGRHVEARDAFQKLIHEHPSSEAADRSMDMLQEEARRVAVVEVSGIEGEVQVWLDGQQLEQPTERFELDAGSHAIRVARDGHDDWNWQGILADGQRLTLAIAWGTLERASVAPEVRPLAESVSEDLFSEVGRFSVRAGAVLSDEVGLGVVGFAFDVWTSDYIDAVTGIDAVIGYVDQFVPSAFFSPSDPGSGLLGGGLLRLGVRLHLRPAQSPFLSLAWTPGYLSTPRGGRFVVGAFEGALGWFFGPLGVFLGYRLVAVGSFRSPDDITGFDDEVPVTLHLGEIGAAFRF